MALGAPSQINHNKILGFPFTESTVRLWLALGLAFL